jgi:hypothetical protein
MNRVKKIIIGAFLFAICILLFQFFNNGKNIIEGHGGGGGGGRGGGFGGGGPGGGEFGGGGPGGGGFGGGGFGHGHGWTGRGWKGRGYYGNNNYYYGVGGAYVNPVYICDEDNDSDICRGRYYGIFY